MSFSVARAPKRSVHSSPTVAIWIHTDPGCSDARAPSGPVIASSTASPSASIVSIRSAPSAASAGDDACLAPSAARGAALSAVRFHTDTTKPAASRLRAIGAPILPVPRTAMAGRAGSRVDGLGISSSSHWLIDGKRFNSLTISRLRRNATAHAPRRAAGT